MPGLIIIVVVFVALAVLVLFWMLRWSKDRAARPGLESPAAETLEYVVPTGQDPVVVMSALESQGFTTRMDLSGEVLHIHCPDGRERARDEARGSSPRPTPRPSSTASRSARVV